MVVGDQSGEAAVVAASGSQVDIPQITRSLRDAGVAEGDTVIVHSSLSSVGWVVGGAQSVVIALLDTVGPDGTVVMPAQTGLSDPARWQNPPVPESWWASIRSGWPAFDAHLTPLRGMGAIAECFHRHPSVVHSGHPANGFIASGRLADTITAGHDLEDSLGDKSPLGRLYDVGAVVVLVGVGHANNTSLHLAEHRAAWPGKATKSDGAPMLIDGQRLWVSYTDHDHDADDFEALGAAFISAGGIERRSALGRGEVRTTQMRDIVDFGVQWLSATRTTTTPRQPSSA